MKIIAIDNFNRDYVSDKLIADNVSEFRGNDIVEYLNDKHSGAHSSDFFKLVDDDYQLYTFEP